MRFRLRSDDLPVQVIDTMCNARPETCRWGCGNQCAHDAPNASTNETFQAVAERYLSRRRFLGGAAGAAGLLLGAGVPGLGAAASRASAAVLPQVGGIAFSPISLSTADQVMVAPGYTAHTLIRWGDMLVSGPPESGDPPNDMAARQRRQFGYNNDYVGFLPNGKSRGLLVVNHEYTNPELMFEGYEATGPILPYVDTELAAHGLSVVALRSHPKTGYKYQPNDAFNRRITGTTPMTFTGPAAGSARLQTSSDPSGTDVLGMLNNCSAGITPWGTVLTCEENFNQYFANNALVTDEAVKAQHGRYGLTAGASERRWENHYKRFDLAQEPNEAFRFGYVVEIDPYDPAAAPRKHTALGRMKHEAATTVIAASGQAVVYLGDDERFDYMYRFVSDGTYDQNVRSANMDLLESGTLYVAKFNDDGTGSWIPMIAGEGPLTAENGFATQADVCVLTRQAADLLGATKMDRPEDIETNPVTGKVYAVMTNNTQRGTSGRPGVDAANPRVGNKFGHIIEFAPAGGDHGADAFDWEIFLICGDPSDDSTYFAGFDKSLVSPISSPDNITFDAQGNLWIATDGQPGTLGGNDGVYAVPTTGPERGYLRQFMSGVVGGECASLVMDDTNTALFVSIQHPAEGSTLAAPSSTFPDGRSPKPAVLVITKDDGGIIGS